MSVATSTAIAIAASAAAAGSSYAAARTQANAAKDAAKSQQAGTDRALQLQQENSAPYRQLGQEGVNRLMQMGPAQPYTQQFRPGQNNGFQAPMTLGGLGGPPPSAGAPQGPPQAVPRGMGMGGLVTLRAPTGEVVRIPDGPMVQQALARGAERMS